MRPATSQFTLELPAAVQSVTLYDAEGKAVRKIEQPQAGRHTVAEADRQRAVRSHHR